MMNKEKQIEEMQVDLMQNLVFSDNGVKCGDSAINLYAKGYRKASEVALKVIGEIEKINTQYCTTIASAVIKSHLTAIKKKYTEEGK